jgi:3-hydroxybutyrate dehydrogenase
MSLKTRNALVTGSTSGIGLAIARAVAAQGANVTINGFGPAGAIETARAEIETDFGVRCRYSAADMTRPAEIAAMVAEAEAAFGSLDILVNNAGIQHVAPIEEFPIEKWDQIIAINLSSAFHAIRAATPGMKARKWGRIICTASAHSLVASPFKSAYVSAKHGIIGLTRTVALEGATFNVRCNAICPGWVDTPINHAHAKMLGGLDHVYKTIDSFQPIGRPGTSREIANVVLFLASDESSFMTGSIVSADGGMTAQ